MEGRMEKWRGSMGSLGDVFEVVNNEWQTRREGKALMYILNRIWECCE
jgi:frataxin-like iron-binding protein CyaY